MDSLDLKERLEALLLCARMMRKQQGGEGTGETPEPIPPGPEASTTPGINFLQADEARPSASLNQIVEEILSNEASRGSDRRIHVQVDLDPAVSAFGLDVQTVGPALTSLVCETIDQSPDDGWVRVETRLHDDRTILLRIRNREAGIPPEERELEPAGASSAATIEESPLEVRLSIVLSITEGGGTLSLTSPPDGAGIIVSLGWDQTPRQPPGIRAARGARPR